MSRIYFNTIDVDTEVRGFERGYSQLLAEGLTLDILGFGRYPYTPRLKPMVRIPPGHHLEHTPDEIWHESARNALSLSFGDAKPKLIGPDGDELLMFVAANTVIAIGSDAWVFANRLHLQCEIHMWVAEQDRPWLAGLITQGRAEGILRPDAGWEETAAMIADAADGGGPVVTSYSVTEDFPDMWLAADAGLWNHPGLKMDDNGVPIDDGAAYDAWDELSEKDQFEIGLRYVHPHAHLTPDNLREKWNTEATAFGVRNFASSKGK